MSDTGDDLRAQLVGFFFEEATEGIEVIEAGLVDLDLDAPDEETINSIFRAMHSIKGASGSFGFTDISNFAHRAETLLDEVRDGSRVLDQEVVDLLLKATDCVGAMVQAIQDEVEPDRVAIDAIAVALQSMLDDRDASSNSEEPEAASLPEEDTTLKQWRIKFSPHPNLLKTGNDPFRIFREVGDLGEMTVHSDATSLPTLAALDPEECHLSWVLELESTCPRTEIEEAFAWVEDECDLEIECGPQSDSLSGEAETESPETADTQVEEKTGAPVATKKARSKSGTKGGAASSIRVSTEKVDALINMVGELVITQSMLNEIGEKFQPDHLDRLMDGLSELERNTRELQDTVMKIRMLPISVTFARFPRLVRDLSQTLGKNIDLQLEGESTELDKTVLEQIGDPLVHLVRNSLDHGLETSEERLAAGKSERGTITLAAFHEGGSIIIQVKDDGRGLNHDKIRAKAIEQGILGPNESCDEQKISELILGAGFSTATEVSDVSGRGVGMDVVQRNIHDLGGSIGIQS